MRARRREPSRTRSIDRDGDRGTAAMQAAMCRSVLHDMGFACIFARMRETRTPHWPATVLCDCAHWRGVSGVTCV